jgi:hypothetical protein
MNFISRYQYGVISNRLKQPVTDRTLIGNRLYEAVTDRFNCCNGLDLTSDITNSCNRHLRSLLPEVHIGNGHSGGQFRCQPAALMCNERKTTTITDLGACNGF